MLLLILSLNQAGNQGSVICILFCLYQASKSCGLALPGTNNHASGKENPKQNVYHGTKAESPAAKEVYPEKETTACDSIILEEVDKARVILELQAQLAQVKLRLAEQKSSI